MSCQVPAKACMRKCSAATAYSQNAIKESVCMIRTTKQGFDWLRPPNRNSTAKSPSGSGFMVKHDDLVSRRDKTEAMVAVSREHAYIMTAHHVVGGAESIKTCFGSYDMEAELVGMNPDMDFALLRIERKEDIARLSGLSIGDSDELGSQSTHDLTAYGYGLGLDHQQNTGGTLSGRAHNGNASRLQADVAVNPGNSGGPLVLNESGAVIGIITSGYSDAQGVNFAAPITEVLLIAQRILSRELNGASLPVVDRLPSLNCSFTDGNTVLTPSRSGIICTSVHPVVAYPQTMSEACKNLTENLQSFLGDDEAGRSAREKIFRKFCDERAPGEGERVLNKAVWIDVALRCTQNINVVTALVHNLRNNTLQDGDIVEALIVNDKTYTIDSQKKCRFEFWPNEAINFAAILDRLAARNADDPTAPGTIQVQVKRDDNTQRRQLAIPLHANANTFRKMYAECDATPYIVMGGVTVMSFVENHMNLFSQQMVSLLNSPVMFHESILVVTDLMADSPYVSNIVSSATRPGILLIAINGEPVRTLFDCKTIWERETKKKHDHSVTLKMRCGITLSARVDQIKSYNESIAARSSKGPAYVGHHPTVKDSVLPPSSPTASVNYHGEVSDDADLPAFPVQNSQIEALQRENALLRTLLEQAQTTDSVDAVNKEDHAGAAVASLVSEDSAESEATKKRMFASLLSSSSDDNDDDDDDDDDETSASSSRIENGLYGGR